ncbi:MAG TPA: hypothetical protein VEK78_04595 [Gemmatimonadales bacterium]|nr:hypothetical protein [Gemmatimonadales bacterium]
MKQPNRAVALAALLLLPAAAAAAQRDVAYTYTGTVHAVQTTTRSIDLIVGVGMALRLVHIRAAPTTSMAGDGGPVALGDVAPGDVVRADCRMTDTGLVADRIEIKRRGQ